MPKVLVCGSRSWPAAEGWRIRRRLNELDVDTTIIHGDARGADRIAHHHAVARAMPVQRFWPDWNRDGHRAGLVRNLEMLDEQPDLVIAFWDGESRGTRHTIMEAERRGIAVEIIRPGELSPEESA